MYIISAKQFIFSDRLDTNYIYMYICNYIRTSRCQFINFWFREFVEKVTESCTLSRRAFVIQSGYSSSYVKRIYIFLRILLTRRDYITVVISNFLTRFFGARRLMCSRFLQILELCDKTIASFSV